MTASLSISPLACALCLFFATACAAQPSEDAQEHGVAEQSIPQIDDDDLLRQPADGTWTYRRFLRHIMDHDGIHASELPLWLLKADNDVPDRVEAEVHALRQMTSTLRRLSTYSDEEVHIRVMLPRPGWSIIIPIR